MSSFTDHPLLAFMPQTSVSAQVFDSTSRYFGLPTRTMEVNGRTIVYLARRLLPDPNGFSLLKLHRVTSGERLDQIAAAELGDSLQFWRICDANGAMRPEDLTEPPGRSLRITLPQGVPGVGNG